MKDVLGREIKAGDLIVLGRDNRQVGLIFGVVLEPEWDHKYGKRVLIRSLRPFHVLHKAYYISENSSPAKNVNMMVLHPGMVDFPKEAGELLIDFYKEYQLKKTIEQAILNDSPRVDIKSIKNEIRSV